MQIMVWACWCRLWAAVRLVCVLGCCAIGWSVAAAAPAAQGEVFPIGPIDRTWLWSAQGQASVVQADDGLWIQLEPLNVRDNRHSGGPVYVSHLRLSASDLTGEPPREDKRTVLLHSRPVAVDRWLQPGETVVLRDMPIAWMARPNWKLRAIRFDLEIVGRDEAGQEAISPVPTGLHGVGVASVLGSDWRSEPNALRFDGMGLALAGAGPLLLWWLVRRATARWRFPTWVLLSMAWFSGGWQVLMALPTAFWEPVSATILESHAVDRGSFVGAPNQSSVPLHTVAASYLYRYGSAAHVGSQWHASGSPLFANADAARAWSMQLDALRASGRTITVWVNPRNPAQAVVARLPSIWACAIALGLALCIAGLLLRKARTRPVAPGAAP